LRLLFLPAMHGVGFRTVIEPHHLPIGSAPGAGERDRMPAITNGSIGIVVPDLAISIGPANDDPFGAHPKNV
jgi:hypothetical protein